MLNSPFSLRPLEPNFHTPYRTRSGIPACRPAGSQYQYAAEKFQGFRCSLSRTMRFCLVVAVCTLHYTAEAVRQMIIHFILLSLLRVAEINKSTKIASDFDLSSRRVKWSIFSICDFWRNAEDGPKDKQDCGFICFRDPYSSQGILTIMVRTS